MKSWLVFLVGGVCGAAVALSVTRIFFPTAPTAGSLGTDGGNAHHSGTANAGHGSAQTGAGAESAGDGIPLETRITNLRAWTEGRAQEPDSDELYATLTDWAGRDPQAALAWVQGARRLPQRLYVLSIPLAALARKNTADAQAWVRQNVDAHDRAVVLESAFQRLANVAPRVALELVAAFPEKEQPDNLGDALGELITESPQEALGFFNRLRGESRENSARWMLASWARKDAPAALTWMEGQPDMIASQQVRWAFLDECTQSRPDLSVEFLRKFPSTADTYDDGHAVSTLLARSPEHGVEALSLVSPATAQSALTMWARDAFEKSPERAMELLQKWVPDQERRGVIRSGFEAWLDSDQRAAMEWLGTVTQPELRVSLQAGVIGWQAQRDPEAALAVLNGPHAASPELQDVVAQALSGWMQRDVTAAANWMVANPGLVTPEQATELTNQFLIKDEEAGADWLAKMPAGAARDAAVETAAIHWAEQREPELATQAAGTIRDPEKRTRALFGVYNALKSSDQAAAEAWLLGAQELTEETKQSWRALAGGR